MSNAELSSRRLKKRIEKIDKRILSLEAIKMMLELKMTAKEIALQCKAKEKIVIGILEEKRNIGKILYRRLKELYELHRANKENSCKLRF